MRSYHQKERKKKREREREEKTQLEWTQMVRLIRYTNKNEQTKRVTNVDDKEKTKNKTKQNKTKKTAKINPRDKIYIISEQKQMHRNTDTRKR